jgi:hypothetical protein
VIRVLLGFVALRGRRAAEDALRERLWMGVCDVEWRADPGDDDGPVDFRWVGGVKLAAPER